MSSHVCSCTIFLIIIIISSQWSASMSCLQCMGRWMCWWGSHLMLLCLPMILSTSISCHDDHSTNVNCICYSFHCAKVAGNVLLHYSSFIQIDPNKLSWSVCPLQSRGCSATAATSSRARGTWTWAAPTQRSSPAPTHTKASNTVSALRQRAVSKRP